MSRFMLDQPEVLAVSVSLVSAATALAYYLTRPNSPRQAASPLSRDIGGGVRISSLCPTNEVIDKPYDGVETLYDAFQRGLRISGDSQCMGHRNGDKFVWTTYNEVEKRAKDFGSGLVAEGIKPGGDIYIGIIGVNCLDWVVAQLGSVFYSVVFVPMYDTLGDEAMSHILQKTGCQIVVAHPDKVAKMANFLRAGSHEVRVVVKMVADPSTEEKSEFQELGVAIKSMQDIEGLGQAAPQEVVPPAPEDVYTICYTSGTTGIPKGALISHQNMTTTMAGVMLTNSDFILSPEDVHFSYLPLCHLFEMNVHMFVYTAGASVGIYSGTPLAIPDDIRILQPTVFPAVPRVLNKFKDKIQKSVAEKGAIAQWIFEKALESKFADLKKGIMRQNIWDKILLQKIRDMFGGKINLIATGAAPVLPETLNFFRAVFAANVYEGFGQTESTAGSTFTQPFDFIGGHVGPPLPGNLVKLVDSDETGHFVKDGKGEVCVKGKNVFMGYYKDEKNTKAALDDEGWLHTGDIGEWNPAGCLRIIDRKKYIFKTSLGEYIAPEKIENMYELHGMVQQMFIDGNTSKSKIAAVIIPDEDNLQKWAATIGKGGMSYSELLEDPVVNTKFITVVNAFAKTKLKSFELAAKIRLVDVALTVENDMVTPTFKKKRPCLKRHFSQMFDVMYSEIN